MIGPAGRNGPRNGPRSRESRHGAHRHRRRDRRVSRAPRALGSGLRARTYLATAGRTTTRRIRRCPPPYALTFLERTGDPAIPLGPHSLMCSPASASLTKSMLNLSFGRRRLPRLLPTDRRWVPADPQGSNPHLTRRGRTIKTAHESQLLRRSIPPDGS